jgi:hypothetical protein
MGLREHLEDVIPTILEYKGMTVEERITPVDGEEGRMKLVWVRGCLVEIYVEGRENPFFHKDYTPITRVSGDTINEGLARSKVQEAFDKYWVEGKTLAEMQTVL